MTFTDEDLKQLKDFVRENVIRREFDCSGDETILFKYKMESLLYRLDSAEKALKDAYEALYSVYDPYKNDCPLCDNFMGPCKDYCNFPKFHKSLETWRKTTGEADGL